MREELLEVKKEITQLKDNYEFLPLIDREKLKDLELLKNLLITKMNKDDLQFVDEEFSKWLKEYININTKIIIKPGEDCNF
jgi:hypothetical protein